MSGRIVLVAGLVAAMTVAASMGGCAHRPPSANLDEESGAAPLTACWPFTGRPVPADPIIFALGDSVNPLHAPVPHNLSERMVFRNLYETLVQVDCDGDVIPSLATAWYSYDEDRRWVFYLRRSTRFWDGTPLRADHVAASWQATRRHSDKRPGDPLVWLDASTVQTIGPDRLVIELPESQADLPLLLAHPALAVALPVSGAVWPLGTGPCRPADGAGAPDPDLVCLPNAGHPSPPLWERITFRVMPGRDPRELAAGPIDAFFVGDRAALEYLTGEPERLVIPLPWDRIYLLLVPPVMATGDHERQRQDPAAGERERQRWYTGWQRTDLAREVVGGSAQPVFDPFFANPAERICPQLTGPVVARDWPSLESGERTATRDKDLIIHPDGDEDARRLAERIAVLAARPLRPARHRPGSGPLQPPYPPVGAEMPQAIGVDASRLAGAIQSARAGAYILPLQRVYPSPCLQLSMLLSTATWLQRAAFDSRVRDTLTPPGARAAEPTRDFDLAAATKAAQRLDVQGIAKALVATRRYLVLREAWAGVTLAYDGTPLLAGAGAAEPLPTARSSAPPDSATGAGAGGRLIGEGS